MKRTLWISLGALVVFNIVVVCLANRGVFGLSLQLNVRPVEVAALGVNIFIAFFLQYFFASRVSDLRAEKDLLIEYQKEVSSLLRNCREIIESCHSAGVIDDQSRKTILLSLHNLANSLETMELALNESQCKCLSHDFLVLKNSYYKYKRAATGGSFPMPYTPSMYNSQDVAYRNFRANLQSLLFKINKFH